MASDMVEEVRRNCSILCLDVPEGTEFGIDYGSWSVGPKFKGVKLVPPGVHYVYYSAADKLGNVAPKTSFFLCLQPGEIVVRRWNPQTEDLDEISTEEAERFASSVAKFEFDQFLGVYPKERLSEWLSLSKHVVPSIVSTLEPIGKKIFSLYESLDPKEKELLDSSLKNRDFKKVVEAKIITDEQQQKLNPEKTKVTYGRTPYYSTIPNKKSVPKNSKTATDLTMHHFDKSPILEDIIKRYKSEGEEGVLGELEFAFICFLFGQDFEGFEHWKNLLTLLCNCDVALSKHPNLFIEFMKVLSFQLKQIPEDFFTDIVSSQNFLLATLKGFFELLNDDNLDINLVTEGRKLHEEVERRFGKVFSSDPMYIDEFDEDAPVVVELND